MIVYNGVNQQLIYNLKTRIIYILAFIWFDEGFRFYDNVYGIANKNDNDTKLGDV